MTTPALLQLRETCPHAHITLLTPEKLGDLWHDHIAINETLTFGPTESALSIGRRLRPGRYDVGLIFPNSFRSALELWWAGVAKRIGYAGQLRSWSLTAPVLRRPESVRMRKRSRAEILRLTDSAARAPVPCDALKTPDSRAHHSHEYLHLLGPLGISGEARAPQLFVSPITVRTTLEELAVPVHRPLFAINAGAEYGAAKRWPVDYFIEAAQQIARHTDCCWLVLGGKHDSQLAAELAAKIALPLPVKTAPEVGPRVINLAGRTSLRQLCALLKASQVLLTNDTGPMHVAAALGTPVVAVFGSTSPALTAPGLPGDTRHRLLTASAPCSPCFLRECPIDFRCMRGISVASAVSAVLEAAAGSK